MLRIKPRHFYRRCWEAWRSDGVWSAAVMAQRGLFTAIKNLPRSLRTKLVAHLYECIYVVYYGWVFDRPVAGEKRLSVLVRALEKRQQKEDIPEVREVWESQYRSGFWDYLSNREEVSRYSVIVGYIQYFKPAHSILDIGCGAGILQERLGSCGYTRYVGLDLSEAAIEQAQRRVDAKTLFIHGDADAYMPLERFDIIIFNESLHYFDHPLESFARYTPFLKENGLIITSLFRTTRSMAIRRRLTERYPVLVETKIINSRKGFTWFCDIFVLLPNPA
jgi:2-polyprenyl-3-methyl-5-hydroxy-6-metoxy-1,4-benzoquinol methylase